MWNLIFMQSHFKLNVQPDAALGVYPERSTITGILFTFNCKPFCITLKQSRIIRHCIAGCSACINKQSCILLRTESIV